jgi:hypothetical protein
MVMTTGSGRVAVAPAGIARVVAITATAAPNRNDLINGPPIGGVDLPAGTGWRS